MFGHKLNVVWKDVGPLVRDLLNAQRVSWTSIDVVRFITDGDGGREDSRSCHDLDRCSSRFA